MPNSVMPDSVMLNSYLMLYQIPLYHFPLYLIPDCPLECYTRFLFSVIPDSIIPDSVIPDSCFDIPDSVIPNSIIPDSCFACYNRFRYTRFPAPVFSCRRPSPCPRPPRPSSQILPLRRHSSSICRGTAETDLDGLLDDVAVIAADPETNACGDAGRSRVGNRE